MEKIYRSILILVLGIFTFISTSAEVIYVKPNSSSSAWQGKSPVYSSLQDALSYASFGDQIWVSQGVYYPTGGTDMSISFELKEGVEIYGGFNGTEDALNERDHILYVTTLSGGIGGDGREDNTTSVVRAVGSSVSPITSATVLDGFIIEEGYALNIDVGGALYLDYASPLIQNVWFRNNSGGIGAAVFGTSTSEATFANCIFSDNKSYSAGGGVYAAGAMTFYHCIWYGNTSDTAPGAATFTSEDAHIYNSIIWGNGQETGAAVSGASIFYSIVEGGYSGDGNIESDPLFYDASQNDFRLETGSPALEAGSNSFTPVWLTTDYLNNSRISGIVDMGVYEGSVETPQISSPGYGDIFESGITSVELVWNWSEGEPDNNVGYKIEYKLDGVEQDAIEGLTLNSYSLDIIGSGKIEWRVAGVDIYDNLSWSNWSVFCIKRGSPVYVKPGGGGSGQSWSDATNLPDAIDNYISGDELWLAEGVYKPNSDTDREAAFELKEGMQIYGGFKGVETSRDERDWYNNKTRLSGEIGTFGDCTDNSNNVIIARGTEENPITLATIVDGVVIEKGYDVDTDGFGAGVQLTNASVSFSNVWFRDNYSYSGGAVYGDDNSSPEFYNCILSNNNAIRYGGAVRAEKRMVFTNCVFYGNSAGDRGGAIDNADNETFVSVYNSIAWGNVAPSNSQFYAIAISNSLVEGGYGETDVLVDDPLFLNAEEGDFRINLLSPCIDAGNNGFLSGDDLKDYSGQERTQGLFVDLGVFEGGNATPFPESPALSEVLSPLNTEVIFEWKWQGSEIPSEVVSYSLEYSINDQDVIEIQSIDKNQLSETVTGFSSADKITWRIAVYTDDIKPYYSPYSVFYIGRGTPIYVKSGASGSGESWTDATDLQTALDMALFGDELWLAEGTYIPTDDGDREVAFEVKDGVRIYGGFSGSETSLIQRDPDKYATVLSGEIGSSGISSDNTFHIVKMEGRVSEPISNETILDGLIIEDGYANISINENEKGGGLYLNHASPTITNVIFRNNYAKYGGALVIRGNSSPRFGNVIFYDNESEENGGALYTEADGDFYNCVWYNNNAGSWGGAIYADSNNESNVLNSIFRNNKALLLSNNFRNVNVSYSLTEDISSGSDDNNIGDGCISGDPLFIDEQNYDFRLNHSSEALDLGSLAIPDWLVVDFSNNSRVLNSRVDIGVFEGGTDTAIPTSPANDTAIALDEGSVTLQWFWPESEPVDVTDYSLVYNINGGEQVVIDNISDLSYVLNGLNVLDRVEWRIYSNHNDGSRRWSAPSKFIVTRGHPIYVTTDGQGQGTSWSDATSLHEALFMAVETDELWLSAGTYYPTEIGDRNAVFELPDGISIYGGFSGSEVTLDERSWLQNMTIISGDIGTLNDDTDNSYNLIKVEGTSDLHIENLIIDGLIIEGSRGGSAMVLEYASPIIRNIWFKNNITSDSGGAIWADSDSEAQFGNVIFTDNSASVFGGAVFAYGALSFYNCLWYENSAPSYGGALAAQQVNIYNSIAWSNSASNGSSFFGPTVAYSIVEGGYDGTGNFDRNPLFLNAESNDFQLRKGSPALDVGQQDVIPDWLLTDFSDNARIEGENIDLGPFEGYIDVELNAPVASSPIDGTVFSTNTKTVTLEWKWLNDIPEGVVSYDVEYRINDDDFQTFSGISSMKQAVVNLMPGYNIRWRVRANTSEGTLDWSDFYTFSVSLATGILETENDTQKVELWPNPLRSGDKLNIEMPFVINQGVLQIFDLSGLNVEEIFFKDLSGIEVNTAGLIKGVYLLRVYDLNGKSWTETFVVK